MLDQDQDIKNYDIEKRKRDAQQVLTFESAFRPTDLVHASVGRGPERPVPKAEIRIGNQNR